MTEKKLPFFIDFRIRQFQNAYRHYKKMLFPPTPVGYDKKDEAFLSKQGLFRVMLFSSFCFAVAFLLVRALSMLVLSGLLIINDINHIYSIFNITYLPGDETNWSDGNLLVVYGLPSLAFLAGGIYLTRIVFQLRKLGWIYRLMLAWLAFSLVVFFLTELLSAVFFYKGFGIALRWMISNEILKISIVAVSIIGLVLWSKRFGLLFLRCCPSRIFIEEPLIMRTWLIWVVLIPLLTGTIYLLFILFFSLKISLVVMIISAFTTLPLAFRSIDYLADVRIYKSRKIIPGALFTLSLMIILGFAVRLLIMFV